MVLYSHYMFGAFSVLFVLIAGLCIICVGALSGFNPISNWEESYYFTGKPFEQIASIKLATRLFY